MMQKERRNEAEVRFGFPQYECE